MWDVKSKTYKDCDAKQKSIKNIAEQCDMSGKEVPYWGLNHAWPAQYFDFQGGDGLIFQIQHYLVQEAFAGELMTGK